MQTRLYNTINQALNSSTSIIRDLMASGVSTLPESGIALAAQNFLECENQTAKEIIVSLAVVTCTQGNVYSWVL
jgi:hypothetical protein